jgi:hypothetical protein
MGVTGTQRSGNSAATPGIPATQKPLSSPAVNQNAPAPPGPADGVDHGNQPTAPTAKSAAGTAPAFKQPEGNSVSSRAPVHQTKGPERHGLLHDLHLSQAQVKAVEKALPRELFRGQPIYQSTKAQPPKEQGGVYAEVNRHGQSQQITVFFPSSKTKAENEVEKKATLERLNADPSLAKAGLKAVDGGKVINIIPIGVGKDRIHKLELLKKEPAAVFACNLDPGGNDRSLVRKQDEEHKVKGWAEVAEQLPNTKKNVVVLTSSACFESTTTPSGEKRETLARELVGPIMAYLKDPRHHLVLATGRKPEDMKPVLEALKAGGLTQKQLNRVIFATNNGASVYTYAR